MSAQASARRGIALKGRQNVACTGRMGDVDQGETNDATKAPCLVAWIGSACLRYLFAAGPLGNQSGKLRENPGGHDSGRGRGDPRRATLPGQRIASGIIPQTA